MIDQVSKWYFEQTISSRILVAIAAAMVVLFVLIKLIYTPWKNHLNDLEFEVKQKSETVAIMESQLKKYAAIIKANQSPDKNQSSVKGGSFISQIERSAKEHKLYSSIERISPDKVGRVKIWMNQANFDAWLKWLEKIKYQGIDVYDVRITQLNPQDKVNLRATFQSKLN